MRYSILLTDERQKMTENIDPRTDPAYKALVEVINAITSNNVPVINAAELAAGSCLRALQWQIDDRNVLDDGELIDVLNQARIEIKYLCSIITELREKNREQQTEMRRLENVIYRAN